MKTIFRSKLTEHFTTLPNAMLRDKALSFKARGILAMVLSNRDDWEVSKSWLQEQGTEGREAVTSGLDELRAAGYVTVRQERTNGAKFDRVVWEFRDAPIAPDSIEGAPLNGKPHRGKRQAAKPEPEKPDNGKPHNGKPLDDAPASGEPATKKEHKAEGSGSELGAAPPAPDANPHQTFIKLFTEGYKVRFDREYMFQGAKDGNAVKMLLAASRLQPAELFAVAKQAWDRMHLFGCKRAMTIAGFLSAFNEIREEIASGNPAGKLPVVNVNGKREYVLGARPPQSGGWDSTKFRAQMGLATTPAEQVNGHATA